MLSAYLDKILREFRRRAQEPALRRCRASIAQNPLDPGLHQELSKHLARAGRVYAAHAALRSASFLRMLEDGSEAPVTEHWVSAEKLRCMDHNQYFRFLSLSNKVLELSGAEPVSLLDVGGGEGQLAQFLPDKSYFLAEPSVNGVSSESLPFDEGAFDYVVCCHVLEHIAPQLRHRFLDGLVLTARRGVILLNPFFDERTSEKERLQLFIDVTNAAWAREHLECTLPKLDFVKEYASSRGLQVSCEPNGFLPLSAAMVFANYYCSRSGRISDFEKINEFFNTKLADLLNSAECPNSLLITLKK